MCRRRFNALMWLVQETSFSVSIQYLEMREMKSNLGISVHLEQQYNKESLILLNKSIPTTRNTLHEVFSATSPKTGYL